VAEKKPKRKELLKEPDEFITWSATVVAFARSNPRAIAIGVSVVVLIALVSLLYYGYENRRQATSHETLETAVRAYESLAVSADSQNSSEQDKLLNVFDQISKEYGNLPTGEISLLYSGHILFKKGAYNEALDKYNQFQSSDLARRGLGSLALYNVAESYMALKDYEKAINLFEQLTRDINSPYRREAYSSIARIYEMMGKKK